MASGLAYAAAPHHGMSIRRSATPQRPSKSGKTQSLNRVYGVPGSSLDYGIARKGLGVANDRFYLVRGKHGHFKKVWAPSLGGRYGHLDSVEAQFKHQIMIGGAVQQKHGIDDLPAIFRLKGRKVVQMKIPPQSAGAVGVGPIIGSGAHDVWAVGSFYGPTNSGGPQVLHFNGHKWTTVQVPQSVNYDGLYDIAAITPKNAWGLRGDGDVLHWDGVQWTDTGQVLGANTYGIIAGTSAKSIYMTGSNDTTGKIDKFNGHKWVHMKVKGVPDGAAITSMVAIGKQAWAVANYRNAKNNQAATVLHTTGRVWAPEYKTHGGSTSLGDLAMNSAKHGLIVGSHASSLQATYHPFTISLHGHKWKKGHYHLGL
jgi:regulation of enolase protein 1 (concanavalin A-like superfamily)